MTTVGQKAARICLFFAGLSFVFGWMVLCYCPEAFMGAAALLILAAALGQHAIRLIGIVLLGVSLLSASHMDLKNQEMKAKAQQIRLKHELRNKSGAVKPLATGCLWRIIHAA